jgi:hypothetical protein
MVSDTSAITGGLIIFITVWWFIHGKGTYQGPKYFKEAAMAMQQGLPAAEKLETQES